MKIARLAIAAALLAAGSASHADPGVMIGLSYNFGGTFGITAKVLSSDRRDRAVAAAGVSYFPLASGQKFGVDVGAGYNFTNSNATVGWDFLNRQVQGSVGYVDTRDR